MPLEKRHFIIIENCRDLKSIVWLHVVVNQMPPKLLNDVHPSTSFFILVLTQYFVTVVMLNLVYLGLTKVHPIALFS